MIHDFISADPRETLAAKEGDSQSRLNALRFSRSLSSKAPQPNEEAEALTRPDGLSEYTNPPVFEASEPDVAWAKVVRERLSHICALPAGWDGYRGSPTRLDVAQFTMQLLHRICRPHTPAPAIVPLPSGGLQIEWYTDSANIELTVRAPYRVEAWVADPEAHDEGSEYELSNDFSLVLPWLQKVEGSVADHAAA